MTRRHQGSSGAGSKLERACAIRCFASLSALTLAQYAVALRLAASRCAFVHFLPICFLLVPFSHHAPANIVRTNQVTAGEHDPGASFDVVLASTSDAILDAAHSHPSWVEPVKPRSHTYQA